MSTWMVPLIPFFLQEHSRLGINGYGDVRHSGDRTFNFDSILYTLDKEFQ